MGIIEAKDLVHEYIIRDEEGNVESIRTALDHMDLSVEAGQFIAVLGHNGSGKSTFAKHLNALLTPSEGTLIVDGMDVSDESLTYDIRQEAGMVFQNPDNQIIASVVQEDVGFGPENIGVPTEEIWERVEKSLKAVGMWQYREHSPNNYPVDKSSVWRSPELWRWSQSVSFWTSLLLCWIRMDERKFWRLCMRSTVRKV